MAYLMLDFVKMRRVALVLAFLVPALAHAAIGSIQTARPWMGVVIEPGKVGVRLTDVYEGTPAFKAGLKKHDEVLAIDGFAVKQTGELINRVSEKGVGQSVTLRVLREKKELTVTLALEAKPDELKLLRDALLNKPAPAFDVGGATLASMKGQVVVVEFWATWCGPCRTSMPRLGEWQKKYAAKGLRVIGITDEKAETIAQFVAQKKPGYTVGSDAKAKETYRVPVIPMMVVIDRAGIVRHVEIGGGNKLDLVEQAFVPLLAAAK
jgi:thiol-disulfide isomerase/thioredoxin